jgi:3-hydroxyisobutyrate dehydrogenase-like beta-hydroxyacid dehydrogenase
MLQAGRAFVDGARAKSGEIALIGFGEAAEAFRIGWGRSVSRARAFDVELLDPDQAARMAERCRAAGVECCDSPEQALADAGLVLCLITADQALAAAKAAAPHLFTGTLWLDGNSCSPGTKRAAAAVIETGGGLYVDMAIMAPVYPRRHKTPVLLAGPAAEPAAAALRRLGMAPEVAGLAVGEASMIKMLRSVMVKGMEALTAECFLAARRAGVDAAVLRSLQSSDPSFDWKTRAAYNLERMIVHGGRRAAEMREVAATLRELGFPDRMAAATAVWQDEIGALSLADGAADLAERADRILDRLP